MSLQKLLDELEVLKVEYEKFERGNKSAVRTLFFCNIIVCSP